MMMDDDDDDDDDDGDDDDDDDDDDDGGCGGGGGDTDRSQKGPRRPCENTFSSKFSCSLICTDSLKR